MVANGQSHRRHTGNFTDTRLTAATKPLIIQRFLTLAKVALRPVLPAQRAPRAGRFTGGVRRIPSPDAALGDGDGRSAAIATPANPRAMLLKTRPKKIPFLVSWFPY
jgi:hypothetical protein